jgi:hypothetical protein
MQESPYVVNGKESTHYEWETIAFFIRSKETKYSY